MFVPFSVNDFLDRAAQVYGERVGVIDEPRQPAASQKELTYARVADLARRQAARLDELGIGVGERVAIVSHNSSRLLTSFFGVCGSGRVLVPVNFRLRPDEVRYIVEHSGARVLYVDPELEKELADVGAEHRFVLGDDEQLYAGDTAIVAMQYGYLPSLFSVLMQPGLAAEAGLELYEAVHERWSQLPADSRPRLVLYGKSLGSNGIEAPFAGADAASSVANLVAAAEGALLVGAPSGNPIHSQVTRERDPGSPVWQPIVDGGRTVRFLNRDPNQPSWTWTPECHTALAGGYVIEVQRSGDDYRWEQITPQITSTPLPPGEPVPPGFERCDIFRSTG